MCNPTKPYFFRNDEDFNPDKALNYPKMDHDKKWNHTRSRVKVESLDELADRSPNGELPARLGSPQISDKTNVEATADIHILVENLLESSSEQEREIIGLLSKGYNQSEIAKRLGISQSTVSRKVSKFKKFLSAGV